MKQQNRLFVSGLAALTLLSMVETNASAQDVHIRQMHGDIPEDTTITIKDSAVVFTELTLNEGSLINFSSSLTNVNIRCLKLVLNGNSTLDLTPAVPPVPLPDKPGTPGAQGQARADSSSPHDGPSGTPGAMGGAGRNGINLEMTVDELFGTNGLLWIKTDGTPGGPGGDGGNGGKGSSGPRTGIHNPDGGNGGTGGKGGRGGKGGDTAGVKLTIANVPISATQATGVAPSTRPQSTPGSSTIIISGAPALGGPGGNGGQGGDGGEGHGKTSPFNTGSKSGSHGAVGQHGDTGPTGNFVALPPPNP